MVEDLIYRVKDIQIGGLTLILLILIFLFSLISLGLIGHLFYSGYLLKKRARKLELLQNDVSDLVAEYLSGVLNVNQVTLKLQEKINRHWKEKVLSNFFLDAADHFKGENMKLFRDLFYNLQLHARTVKMLKSRSWDKKVNGAKLAGKFKVREAFPELINLQNTNRKLLRSEIRAALLQLNNFRWVRKNFSRVSDWDQVLILEKLKKDRISDGLDGKEWLHSRHPSMVIFGIRLCYLFNDFDSVPEIKEIIIKRKEIPLVLEGLKAIKILHPFDSHELAKELIREGRDDVCISVLDLLGLDGSPEAVEIIEKYTSDNYIPVRLAAFRALKVAGVDPGNNENSKGNGKLVAHVNDEKIYRQ